MNTISSRVRRWLSATTVGFLFSFLLLSGCGESDNEVVLEPGVASAATEAVVAVSEEMPVDRSTALGLTGELPFFAGSDLDEIFSKVATGIRYEPYRGILRGAEMTALAGSGNAADQALLLAEALRAAGYQVRFARGVLEGENVAMVLRGMYPPRLPSVELDPELEPFDPASNAELRAIAGDHVWVEVFQGDSWLPLDPSFPRAKPGEAYAVVREHFDQPPRDLYQRVSISIREETRENRNREVGVIEGTTVELGLRPITVVSRAVPQSAAGDVDGASPSPGGLFGGLGGALGGQQPAEEEAEPTTTEPEVVGVRYRRYVNANGERREVGSTLVLDAERSELIRREWLEITLTEPGARPTVVERTLYPTGPSAVPGGPPEHRTYAINVVPAPLPAEWVYAEAGRAASSADIPGMQNRLEQLARTNGPQTNDAAVEIGSLGEAAGTIVGHLAGLHFAASSDEMSRTVARVNGVAPVWARPRVLITSIETVEERPAHYESTVSLDLRINEIEAYSYPGVPAEAATLFQMARGLQDTILEGEVIARATGFEESVNVSPLMALAHAEEVPVFVLTSEDRSPMGQLRGLPSRCNDMITRALDEGRHVIVPERAIQLAGGERWGWWELDPATGHMIGVMESGQHQAMTEYKLSLERVGLNDDMGLVLGAMVGSTATMILISALLLEHGAATAAMIEAVEKQLEQLLCRSCFTGAEASDVQQVSMEVNAGCVKWKKSQTDYQEGVSATVSFCEKYHEGFKCASGMLLNALKGQPAVDLGISIGETKGSTVSVGCTDIISPRKTSASVSLQDGIVVKPW